MKRLLILLFFVLLLSNVSAFNFDNIKNFEKKEGERYGSIKITNAFGLGNDIAKYELLENTDQCLTQCEAKLSITLYSAGTLIDALKMKSSAGVVLGALPGQKTLIKTGEEEYTVDEVTYETICTPALLPNGKPYSVCQQVPLKKTKVTKTRDIYAEYVGQAMPAGTYTFKIVATKKAQQSVDWIATGFGKEMTEWAWWIGVSPSAYWKFNESTPNTAANLVDAAVVMTKINTPLTVAGKLGNGVNVTYSAGLHNSMNTSVAGSYGNWTFGTGDFSVCYWVNVPPTSGGGSRLYLDNFPAWVDNNGWAFYIDSAGQIAAAKIAAGLPTSTQTYNNGAWHRICWTRSGSANKYYGDGVNVVNFTDSTDFSANNRLAVNHVGAGGGDTSTMKGMIDDLQIFKGYAWSVADVIADYNGGAGKEGDITQVVATTTLNSPANGATNTSGNQFFNATLTVQNGNPQNATFYLYNATSQAIIGIQTNTTIANAGTSVLLYFNNGTLPEGSYKWNVLGCANGTGLSACDWDSNFTFTIDQTAPTISLIYPSVSVPYAYSGLNTTLNFSVGGTPQACSYNYNATNYALNCAKNSTIILSRQTNLSITANDSTGNSNTTYFYWNYTLFENSNTYNNPVFESSQESFSINVTAISGLSISSGKLNYNGTLYNSSVSIAGDNYIFSSTATIPSITSQINQTFYWSFVTSNGTINSTSRTQTVNDLSIDNCTTNTIQILNYTIFNEDTRAQLNPAVANISANIYLKFSSDFSGTNFIYFANSTSANPIKICISNALSNGTNYRVDSTIQYSATGFVTEYHIIQNTTVNTTAQPLSYNLYDLLTTSSQEFLITYKDSNFNAVSGALITLTRQYLELGQFLPVEIAETDTDGRTIEHFVLNDQVYTIYVRKNNQLLSTFENVRVYCSSAITDCKLNLFEPGSSSNTDSFVNYRDTITSINYNATTRIYAVQYLTTDSSSKTFNLTIRKADNYGTTILCSQQATSYAGTLSCTIPSTTNGTAIASMTVDGNLLFTDSFSLTSLLSSNLTPLRFLFAFILVATLPLMGIGSGVMTVLFGVIGLIAAGMFSLVDWGGYIGASSALMWFIIAAIILIWKASKGRQDG